MDLLPDICAGGRGASGGGGVVVNITISFALSITSANIMYSEYVAYAQH